MEREMYVITAQLTAIQQLDADRDGQGMYVIQPQAVEDADCRSVSSSVKLKFVFLNILNTAESKLASPFLHRAPGMARGAQAPSDQLWWLVGDWEVGENSVESSPLRTLMVGTVSRTARVSVVRRNLKEAAGKTLARRTEIAYEAVTSGREGKYLQSPIIIRRVWL